MNAAKNDPFFHGAMRRAERYIRDPERLKSLAQRASRKAADGPGPLEPLQERLTACVRLIRAYARGRYRVIPWNSLLMLVAALIYFVMPVDAVPDFVVGLGLLDDVAVLGWALKTFQEDIDAFVAWEACAPEVPSGPPS